MADDDDDEGFGGAYENGHWIWDDAQGGLLFVSDLPEEEVVPITVSVKLPTNVEFKEIDLIEQMRFRKMYQRKVKPGRPDVITVQDVKDFALYTAPLSLLSNPLISFLHLSTTERFIRALILYCQCYLETSEVMAKRTLELATKVRTPICEQLEAAYRENLCDLRNMVAKEYCTMLIGGDDTKKFHHMGAQKKIQSLSGKDKRLFETMLRMVIQIVWLALSRRSLNFLELEVNRLFKSEIFNTAEHTLHVNYLSKMTPEERSVLLGPNAGHDKKLNTNSPLTKEIFSTRPIDFRSMGLGVIEYDNLPPRLRYLLVAVAGPEEEYMNKGITVGILGLPRSYFDPTLQVLPTAEGPKKSKSSMGSASSVASNKPSQGKVGSSALSSKSIAAKGQKEKKFIYNNISLPPKEPEDDLPEEEVAPITVSVKLPTKVEFKELDLIEQMRFRKMYQRKVKPGRPDVITVQDVKDFALYTAPLSLLSNPLISFLHLSTTERFLRALILYCQYYLETSEVMAKRMLELATKVRTPICEQLEAAYRENLCDLRNMVAKEYCTMLIGGDDTKKFHHMGAQKKIQSLSGKDKRLFETMLRMVIQIVWLALSRRSLNCLELEVNRLFKSEIFNTAEHTLHTNYLSKMTPEERSVLLGPNAGHDQKLNTNSPLTKEIFSARPIDFRSMGLGVIEYNNLPPRLRYLLVAVAGPEEDYMIKGVTVGILGLPRSYFDPTLQVLPTTECPKKSKSSISAGSVSSNKPSQAKVGSPLSSKSVATPKGQKEKKFIYNNISLPPKEPEEPELPSCFPEMSAPVRRTSVRQCWLWKHRLQRLLHPARYRRKSTMH